MNYTQSEGTAARRRFPLYLVDATDGITPETGEAAGQPQISKAGGAWTNTTATLTALGNGGYYVELTAAELDTLGTIAVRYKSANTAEFQAPAMVVAYNQHDAVRAGLTALPNAAADAAGGLPISDAGGLDLDARLDAAITSRLAPTTAGRTLDVSVGGEAGVDWANVGSPTTVVGLSGTTVKTATDVETDTADIQTRIPAALTAGGNIKADALAFGGAAVTATTSVTIPAASTLATTTGAVGSVTGAVGSVTAGVTLAASAIQAIWDAATSALTTVGSIGKRIVDYLTGDAFARLGAPAGASVSADLASVKTDTGTTIPAAIAAVQADLPQRITKNVALAGFQFLMVDSTDHITPKTGLTVTATRSLDGAAFASCANAVSELSNGWYVINLAAADLNGNTVALKFSATGGDTRNIMLVTQPT